MKITKFADKIKEKKSYQILEEILLEKDNKNLLTEIRAFKDQFGNNLADIAVKYQNIDALRLLGNYEIVSKGNIGYQQIILLSQSSRFKNSQNSNKNSETPTLIIIGDTGSGKTSLFNLLCGTNKLVKEGGYSTTRNLVCIPVKYGDHPYEIIDSPGVNSTKQTYLHAYTIYSGLTAKLINAIVLLIPFAKRIQTMTQAYKRIVFPFQKYDSQVIIMISFFDIAKDKKNMKKQITQAFRIQNEVADIIFYSNQDGQNSIPFKDYLSNTLFKCANKFSPIQIQITKQDFFSAMKLYHSEGELSKINQQFCKKSQQIKKDYQSLALIASGDQDPEGIFNFLIASFRNEFDGMRKGNVLVKQGLIQIYNKKACVNNITELQQYTLMIQFTKQALKIKSEFKKSIQGLIKQRLIQYSGIKKLVRKCPHCGQIWIKSAGCNGSTTCGKRPGQADKLYSFGYDPYNQSAQNIKSNLAKIWGYQMQFINGKRSYKRIVDNNTSMKINAYKSNTKESAIGCNKDFIWSQAPMIEQKMLLQLFEADSIQLIKAMIVSDQKQNKLQEIQNKFGKIVKQYEKTISIEFETS